MYAAGVCWGLQSATEAKGLSQFCCHDAPCRVWLVLVAGDVQRLCRTHTAEGVEGAGIFLVDWRMVYNLSYLNQSPRASATS